MQQADVKKFYSALKLDQSLDYDDPNDRKLYVEKLHASEGFDPVGILREQILFADEPSVHFFTGQRGTGKSTELSRLAYELRQQGRFCIVADATEYFDLSKPINVQFLLLTVAAAIASSFDAVAGGDSRGKGFFTKIAELLNAQFSVEELKFQFPMGSAAKVELKGVLSKEESVRKQLDEYAKHSLPRVMSAINAYIKELLDNFTKSKPGLTNARPVFILDSVERIRISGPNGSLRYEALVETFDTHSNFLKIPGFDTIYSVPPYLPYLLPNFGTYFGTVIHQLPSVRVAERDDSKVHYKQGIDQMLQAVLRRVPNAYQFIPEDRLANLAWASSGSLRAFFMLIRTVLVIPNDGVFPIDNDAAYRYVVESLKSEMVLSTADKAWLRRVAESHGNGLSNLSDLPELARLFDAGMILSYRNGQRWCGVHTLLYDEIKAA
jgi:hypothetical protein